MKKSIKKALIVLIIIFAAIVAVNTIINVLNEPLDSNDSTYLSVTIESGSGTEDIASTLKDAGAIKSVQKFKIISKLYRYDGKYQAGTYSVSPSMTPSDIAEIITNGEIVTTKVTIPEGYTIYQIEDKLADEGIIDKDKFDDLLKNGDFSEFSFLDEAQTGENHLEGYLFPSTYQIDPNANEEQIITTMLNQFDVVYTEKYHKQAEKLGYTDNEIIIIASIIEREANIDEDRAKVASVIYNRFDAGMPLQMCSTVQYVIGKQKETLTVADTEIDSPYNTYVNQGLPPGPICCPGEASIKAALYPDDTDYLYFVVSEKLDGSHNFSSSYSDFEADTEAYSKALDASGNN